MRAKPHWRPILTAAVALAVGSHLAILYVLGQAPAAAIPTTAKVIAWGSLAIFLLWLAFEKWIWAWLPRWVLGWPNLNGTWVGHGKFTFIKDRDLAKEPVDLEITLTIKQTYTRVFVGYVGKDTRKGTSTSSEAYGEISQTSEGDGKYTLRYMFITDPGSYQPNQSGQATLVLHEGSIDRLVGEWLFNPFSPAAGRMEVSRAKV